MKFADFLIQIRQFNPQLTETQANQIWTTFLPFPIQDAIETRIASLKIRSRNLNGDPYGGESRTRSQYQHWVTYQGSSYSVSVAAPFPGEPFSQNRELTFEHYVEVEDLRRDWEKALLLHELLKSLLIGFRPCWIPGVLGPLRLISDGLITARNENDTLYRYKATYHISCVWKPADIPALFAIAPDTGPVFEPGGVTVGIFKSPVDQVGDPMSPKFTDLGVRDGNSG